MAKPGLRLDGSEELKKLLKQLPIKAKDKRFWRVAARGASNPIVRAIKAKVPVDRGDLKKSVKYRNYSNNVLGGRGGYIKFDHWSKSNTMTNPAKAEILVNNRKTKPLEKTYSNFMDDAVKQSGNESLKMMEKRSVKWLQTVIKKLK